MDANEHESNQARLHAFYLWAIRLGWILLVAGILGHVVALMWAGVALLAAGSVMGWIWTVRDISNLDDLEDEG